MGRGEHHHRRSCGAADFAETQSRERAGDRRVSLEQDRALMRILKLTPKLQKQLLAVRSAPDAAALRVAARIIAGVKRRGDAALFAWTKKLDGLDLRRSGVWIGAAEIAVARNAAAPDFLGAVEHAAENVR